METFDYQKWANKLQATRDALDAEMYDGMSSRMWDTLDDLINHMDAAIEELRKRANKQEAQA